MPFTETHILCAQLLAQDIELHFDDQTRSDEEKINSILEMCAKYGIKLVKI